MFKKLSYEKTAWNKILMETTNLYMNGLCVEISNNAQGNSLVSGQTLASQSASNKFTIKSFAIPRDVHENVLIIHIFKNKLSNT